MKKIRLSILALLALVLAACGGASTAATGPRAAAPQAQNSSRAGSGTSTTNAPADGAASDELQLLVGTLKLDGTDQEVSNYQAAVLLPFWTELQSLSGSRGPGPGQPDATAQTEGSSADVQAQITAPTDQIKAAMTPAQLQAIADLRLTRDSALAAMQELGIGTGGALGDGNPPPQDGQPQRDGQAPQPPLGDRQLPPGGQQSPRDGQGGPMRGGPGGGGMVPPQLFDAVMQRLGGTPVPGSHAFSTIVP